MSDKDGLYSVQAVNIDELCENYEKYIGKPERVVEFAIRWQDGEVADDFLCVDTDGYYSGAEALDFNTQTYLLEFAEDTLTDVLEGWKGMPADQRPAASTALRYYIEFDAFIENGALRTGGKWAWGNGGNRPAKREPKEFYEKWRHS